METNKIIVLSLHPDPSNPLGLDLKHILSAFGCKLADWVWCVKNLDWLGENGASFCQTVEAAGPGGLWINSQELVERIHGIYQTFEGEFLAFPKSMDRKSLEAIDLSLSSFPASEALAAVVAVDGCYFDVYSKDREATRMLQERFPDATAENADVYF
jgi:hypothetical protein